MLKNNKTLLFFTAAFPYGNAIETFIESEILFLSQHYQKVIVFPSVKSHFVRTVPENVFINDVFTNITLTKNEKLKILALHLRLLVILLFSEILSKGFWNVFKGRRVLMDYISVQFNYLKILKTVLSKYVENYVFYSYWFCDRFLALSLLKKKGGGMILISRAHGYDLYDERWPETGVPFRYYKMKMTDHCFLISEFGLDYMQKRIPVKYHQKLSVSKLGVLRQQTDNIIRKKDLKTVVSCSNVIPLKRVHLIAEIIRDCGVKIQWVHFGDGPQMDFLKKETENMPDSIEIVFKGQVKNIDVLNFYATHSVDLFISTSESEGIPVSMMEALSFGIPVLALPVGGVPEIVKEKITGFLFPLNYTKKEYQQMFIHTLSFQFNREKIFEFFLKNFDAQVNYDTFIKKISTLGS